MRLIELAANKASFKTVRFNRTGLTLIVGRHNAKKSNLKNTYNGVGKSLIVSLINYCLGSNKNEQFDKHLAGWSFTLTFEHLGLQHKVVRSTNASEIIFDDGAYSVNKYRERLDQLQIFEMPKDGVPYLTFRSLLSFFLRPKNSSYIEYDRPLVEWKEYQSVLCQSFLLGLDYERAARKHDLKKRLDKQLELADRYKKDVELRAFYVGEKKAEIELRELEAQIKTLEADIASFRVAENYAERQLRADEIHQQIVTLTNDIALQKNLIADLDVALEHKPDVSPRQVVAIFTEANIAFPDLVMKRLDDVQAFYVRLQENRTQRIRKDRAAAQQTLADANKTRARLQHELDLELQFLNAHRALDEYAANNAHLSELRARSQRIKDYLQLQSQ
jgi:uncharacterized protein YydD (DUF2326 family)